MVLLPFLAFLTQAIVGKKDQSGNIGLIAIILSTVCSLVGVFMEVWNHIPMYERIHWFTIGGKSFHVGILLNNLTTLMQLVVCIVALPVHIYSRAYMKSDPGIHRYWMYLSLFCFAMLGLTVSINLLQLYIFLGIGGIRILSIDWILVHQRQCSPSQQESLYNKQNRRLGFLGWYCFIIQPIGEHRFGGIIWKRRINLYNGHTCHMGYLCWISVLFRSNGEIGAIPITCMASRCDGRTNIRIIPYSRSNNGGCRSFPAMHCISIVQ